MQSLPELSSRYRVWFCDIWGVVHNGRAPNGATVDCLMHHRRNGGIVVLVSNSPRTASGVERQLLEIGVDPLSHDAIVTSGDVTRQLIVDHGGGIVFHLGPLRNISIYDGLDVARVVLGEAHAVLCTGLFDETRETPDDYGDLFAAMLQRKLTMICANPDKVVRVGDRLYPCAGALAEAYAALGGVVLMAGKPFSPIYDLAVHKAEAIAGQAVARANILAIGDGPETDIRGAAGYGLDVVLVADGVTDASLGLEAVAAEVRRLVPAANVVATVRSLGWDESGT